MKARSRNRSVLAIAGAGAAAVAMVGAGFQLSAGADDARSGIDLAAADSSATSPVTVTCPDVAGRIGAVPARSQAGVTDELANLVRQIANVNARLAREPGQAANQLNDLAGKRNAVIDRIILDITRVGGTEPAGLRGLAQCALSNGGGAGEETAAPTVAPTVPPTVPPVGGDGGAEEGAGEGAGENPGVAQTVSCPEVDGELPTVPASAAAEVTRNLALLDTQIGEADARLARLAIRPEGGPAFIQNAILGPLEDKRFATLNRIATAIGRTAARPNDLQDLAPCTLNAG